MKEEIKSMRKFEKALIAVNGFIQEWKRTNKHNEIYGLHTGCDREQDLKISDLELICSATYNPETHFLIAKDEVPMKLKDAVARMISDNQIHRHDEEKFELIAELVVSKMGAD